jgi:putative heme transporter
MPPERRRLVRRLALLALAVVLAVVIFHQVGRIDWDEVWDALGHLSWWQPLVLLVLVVGRQVLNALPLHFYIEGLSAFRATINDLGAILMAMVAPPPADYATRVAMFASWGIPAARGLAGAMMNTLTFYIARFSTPALGFVLLAVVGGDLSYRWVDLLFVAVAVGIVVCLVLVLRSDTLARTVGSRGGRLVRRFRRSVDPEAWAQGCADFRGHVAARVRHGFPRSLLATLGMLAVDLAMLVLCLRFVGVSSAEVGLADIAIAYLFAYPFTLFPMSGIGIVDALVVAGLVDAGGLEVEAPAVAALMIWRIFTVGVPVVLGVGAMALWKVSAGTRAAT